MNCVYNPLAMKLAKAIFVLAVIASICCFFIFDLDAYFRLAYIQSAKAGIDAWYSIHPVFSAVIFFVVYVVITGLSLPGAAVMSLAAGAIFSVAWGMVIVSFASVAGATIAFLFSRYVFRDAIQKRFARYLAPINNGIRREGGFYLFTVRLIPVFPFFIVNLLMGLTHIKVFTFVWVSQIGMLPATLVLVNAGKQLARIESIGDIFTFKLLGSMALLGIVPLALKKGIDFYRRRRGLASVLEKE